MHLEDQQIISAANGIVRTEQNDLGLELYRFTRAQESFFYKTHPLFCRESFFNGFFGKNCRTSAGISMDFISDAEEFKINFSKIEILTKTMNPKFDLYVDNELVQSYEANNEIVYQSMGGQHQFILYFPCFAFPIISSVELKNANLFLPIKKQADILFLGDSITHGAYALHPSNTYVMRLARKLDVGILNQGNSGFVYDVGSLEKVCDPKIVITAYGINDFVRKSIPSLEKDTVEFIEKVRELYKNAKIVSILPIWTKHDSENKDFKKAERACLRNIYETYSDYTIDGHSLVPHDQKYFYDGVHPTDAGFEYYGNNLTKEITNMTESLKWR